MAGCKITDGIDSNCGTQRRVGGVKKVAFIFNIEDVTYTFDSSGFITAISFPAYEGLFKFQGQKQSHSGGWIEVTQEPGGNKFYQHDVLLKMITDTPADDAVLEQLLVACVGVILETNNRQFIIYGHFNGLEQTAGVQNSGQAFASDVGATLNLTGGEEDLPQRFLNGTYQQTKDQLETYVI